MPGWIWIPLVLGAAAAQTVRNAAQRHLTATAGTLPATFVRFFYGLPFALATLGVLLLSTKAAHQRGRDVQSWLSPAAFLGLASGACFALSAVGYRGATRALGDIAAPIAGTYAVVWGQALQSVLLGAYLLWRDRAGLVQVMVQWRTSTLAGAMGALASMAWLTAFAMRSAADVRTVGLVEVIYGYAVSRRFFRERVSGRELTGILLVAAGILVIGVLQR